MTWRKNPRTLTKEQFSTGTTIDGDRIDNALDDVVERVNSIPYGDLRKRWVPITFVAGWTPQSPASITHDPSPPIPVNSPVTAASSKGGAVYPTHHWPWLRVKNFSSEVATGTEGSGAQDDRKPQNTFRLKGCGVDGIHPFGKANIDSSNYNAASLPIGSQFAWTRSWFMAEPRILDAIDLVLEVDHASLPASGANQFRAFNNTFEHNSNSEAYAPGANDRGLVITASVDSEFAREDMNMSDVEVLRKNFEINHSTISKMPLSKASDVAKTYTDFDPAPGAVNGAPGGTLQGVHIRLHRLNIPIHQNARLRISVVIPSYPDAMHPNGWNPNDFSADCPWLQQKVHMTVTMLEEVTHG
mgnify:FL=1|jgi:hypothetical protein|tara:strand:+ start:615 stop:1685 length:1071 start_codon:yes stop_codon:yes gene_type:complete